MDAAAGRTRTERGLTERGLTERTWNQANQRYLAAAVARVRVVLERYIARRQAASVSGDAIAGGLDADAAEPSTMSLPSALEALTASFALSPFERDLLLMCAGVELDARFRSVCAEAHGDVRCTWPTFGLALATLDGAHWSALSPAAPLRHWRLIDPGQSDALTTAPLRIDERILHYLAGVDCPEERLRGVIAPVGATGELPASHRSIAEQAAAAWSQAEGPVLPVLQLCGSERAAKHAIAAAACARLGLRLSVLPVAFLPRQAAEIADVIRLWQREAALGAGGLLIDCDDDEAGDSVHEGALARFIAAVSGVLIITTRARSRTGERPALKFDIDYPSHDEQRAMWRRALNRSSLSAASSVSIDALAAHFRLSPAAIHSVGAQALAMTAAEDRMLPSTLHETLWDACRVHARAKLDDLAQRIVPAAHWDDLVLPQSQLAIIREVAMHLRHRTKVYLGWGFASKGARGSGIAALFAGPSGTGKTLAAEVLASELRLDLYRIDLSQVVSKYIGETEKNLRRVFDAAEVGGAILLFDEADALFGKRSEVKDSHDRYANIEVSYLLQRMEAYRGLAILTTNLKSALDTAFLRRIRFIVQFPFPDMALRVEIWRRIFPAATPTDGLDADKLARLTVAGGNIRNIALNATFLAADEGRPVGMAHLLRAACSECAKIEKPVAEAEISGWI